MAKKTERSSKKDKKEIKASKKDKTKKTKSTKTPRKEKAKLKITPVSEKLTKTQLNELIESMTEVPKRDVKKVIVALEQIMMGSITKKGRGEFMLPGLLKVVTKHKPARPKRKGVNPFTGEPCTFQAKPATIQVKVRPMKKLKDAALS